MKRSSAAPATSVRFRFRLVPASEEAPNGRRYNGSADDKSLQLGAESWDLVDLAAVEQDGERLLLLLQPSQQPPLTITISISRINPSQLKHHLDVQRTRLRAERARAQLATPQQRARFRQIICPACDVTVDLTPFPEPPQIVVFNKSDLLSSAELVELEKQSENLVVSARTGYGTDVLVNRIGKMLKDEKTRSSMLYSHS